jgi:hypothetical protein
MVLSVAPVVVLMLGPGAFELSNWAAHRDNLGEIFAAVFGLSLTVVAIVVQLAAQRYSPQIVLYFVRDPINASFFVFIVFSSLFVTLSPGFSVTGEASRAMGLLGVVVTIAAFGLLMPYFVYVFISVQPDMLIWKIQRGTRNKLRRIGDAEVDEKTVVRTQHESLDALHRLADIGVSAVEHSDRDLAMKSLRALQAILEEYSSLKPKMQVQWFEPPEQLDDQFASALLDAMREGRTWFEAAILFELDHMARRASEAMPELVAQISSLVRHIHAIALAKRDEPLMTLIDHFLNTQLRHGINAENLRSLYAVLEHYRRVIESYVTKAPDRATQCAEWLVYYGKIANARSLGFATGIIAHDLRRICLRAFEVGDEQLGERLTLSLLSLDEDDEGGRTEETLVGVRKAQTILATELLDGGWNDAATLIAKDMKDERVERLEQLHTSLLQVKSNRFWEMTDRGENFEYLAPSLRPLLDEFMALVEEQR